MNQNSLYSPFSDQLMKFEKLSLKVFQT